MKKMFAILAALICLFVMANCGGGGSSEGGGHETNTPANEESFINGDITLKASVITSGNTKTAMVKDSDGNTILTLDITSSSATFTSPESSTATIINFDSPLTELPTDYIVKRMAIYVAGPTYSISNKTIYKDHPGCDKWPDTQCTLGCCATHDECYKKLNDDENINCTWHSWFDKEDNECDVCNKIAAKCIFDACTNKINADNLSNNCYDSRCGLYYDCPNYNTCKCKDICAESSTTTTSTTSTSTTTTTSTSTTSTSTSSSLTTTTTTSTSTTTTTVPTSHTPPTMIYVPSGSFQRDETSTNISTVSAFRMSKYEITRELFSAIMGTDPSSNTYSTGTSDPVQMVNWYHAIAFCNKLSIAEGLTPVYSVSGVNFTTLSYAEIPTSSNASWDAATANWSANGYRLPTEMEWMWAAMGATSGYGYMSGIYTTGYTKAFAGSTGSNNIGDYAWYQTNSGLKTHTVGTKLPNELGFYDMSGNVYERCWDWFNDYPEGTLTNYKGPAFGVARIARGGSWGDDPTGVTIVDRNGYYPQNQDWSIGFRVVKRYVSGSSWTEIPPY